eukprot:3289946-Prymnesium_polylepis.1
MRTRLVPPMHRAPVHSYTAGFRNAAKRPGAAGQVDSKALDKGQPSSLDARCDVAACVAALTADAETAAEQTAHASLL